MYCFIHTWYGDFLVGVNSVGFASAHPKKQLLSIKVCLGESESMTLHTYMIIVHVVYILLFITIGAAAAIGW